MRPMPIVATTDVGSGYSGDLMVHVQAGRGEDEDVVVVSEGEKE